MESNRKRSIQLSLVYIMLVLFFLPIVIDITASVLLSFMHPTPFNEKEELLECLFHVPFYRETQ